MAAKRRRKLPSLGHLLPALVASLTLDSRQSAVARPKLRHPAGDKRKSRQQAARCELPARLVSRRRNMATPNLGAGRADKYWPTATPKGPAGRLFAFGLANKSIAGRPKRNKWRNKWLFPTFRRAGPAKSRRGLACDPATSGRLGEILVSHAAGRPTMSRIGR